MTVRRPLRVATLASMEIEEYVLVFHTYMNCPGLIVSADSLCPGKQLLRCAQCSAIVGEIDESTLEQALDSKDYTALQGSVENGVIEQLRSLAEQERESSS